MAAGAIALLGLCVTGSVRAQALPTGVLKMDRFAGIGIPSISDLDGSVRITNPGSPVLRAWGTHVEVTGGGEFTTEAAFRDVPLSAAELDELTEKCGDIFDNGSGAGRCRCGADGTTGDSPGSDGAATLVPGTLCANLYVFAADQQLAECCACAVTPNGLLTLAVRDDLTSNPLTGDAPERGVISLLTSLPGVTGECDPTVPTLPSPPTTTTIVTATTTSTTASTVTTTTTTLGTGSTTTTDPSASRSACQNLQGMALLNCTLGSVGVDPACDASSIKPSVEKLVRRRMAAMRSGIQGADQKGGTALHRALDRADRNLTGVERTLVKAAKHRRLTASCLALLQDQLGGVQGAVASLR